MSTVPKAMLGGLTRLPTKIMVQDQNAKTLNKTGTLHDYRFPLAEKSPKDTPKGGTKSPADQDERFEQAPF